MPVRVRTLVLPTAGAVLVASVVAVTGSGAAAAATCRATPSLLSRAPVRTVGLPGGARERIWDSGTGSSRIRVAVVTIPPGSLVPTVATSAALSHAQTAASMNVADPRAVVVINAQHFNASIPGVPDKGEVRNGSTRMMARLADSDGRRNGIAVYGASRTVTYASATLSGSVRGPRGSVPLGAVNWPSVWPSGVTMYTSAWGTRAHATGVRTVVVRSGIVTGFRSGAAAQGRPLTSEQWLTAASGTTAAVVLAGLRVGDRVSVGTAVTGHLMNDGVWPHLSLGTPSGFVGSGGRLVLSGANVADCASRNEILRPRSAIGWLPDGSVLVATVSNPSDGDRFVGGATVHQWADLLRRLGASNAVNLDGGTSTTLLVRSAVGGGLVRLDRATTAYQRPVVDTLTFRAP